MYAYRPRSWKALAQIMAHEILGPEARFRRHAARLLYVIAAGRHIDPQQCTSYAQELDEVYRNPFEAAPKQDMPLKDIKQRLLEQLKEGGNDDNAAIRAERLAEPG